MLLRSAEIQPAVPKICYLHFLPSGVLPSRLSSLSLAYIFLSTPRFGSRLAKGGGKCAKCWKGILSEKGLPSERRLIVMIISIFPQVFEVGTSDCASQHLGTSDCASQVFEGSRPHAAPRGWDPRSCAQGWGVGLIWLYFLHFGGLRVQAADPMGRKSPECKEGPWTLASRCPEGLGS